jgi:hypothetical protein
MKERDETLNLGALGHRDWKVLSRQRRGNSNVGCLAEPACRVIRAVRVDVTGGKDDKKEGADGQCERQELRDVATTICSRVSVSHFRPPYDKFDAAKPPGVTRHLVA